MGPADSGRGGLGRLAEPPPQGSGWRIECPHHSTHQKVSLPLIMHICCEGVGRELKGGLCGRWHPRSTAQWGPPPLSPPSLAHCSRGELCFLLPDLHPIRPSTVGPRGVLVVFPRRSGAPLQGGAARRLGRGRLVPSFASASCVAGCTWPSGQAPLPALGRRRPRLQRRSSRVHLAALGRGTRES